MSKKGNGYMHLFIANRSRDSFTSIASDPMAILLTSGQQVSVDVKHVTRSLLLETNDWLACHLTS